MEYLYNLKTDLSMTLQPQTYALKEEVSELFAVPFRDTVATTDLDNSITLMGLEEEKIKYQQRFKDVFPYIGWGDLSFLPVFSEDTVAYAQMRGIFIYNFKENAFRTHLICPDMEETIDQAAVVDPDKMLFLFGIDHGYKNIRLVDLSSKEHKVLKELEIEHSLWTTNGAHVFVYRDSIRAFDMKLEPASHLIVEVINRYKRKYKIYDMQVHPELPFAILDEGEEYPKFVSWKNGESLVKTFVNSDPEGAQFSPDGKWMVFRNKPIGSRDYIYYLMAVSPDLPIFLSSPILLGEASPYATAWISEPLSFVMTEGQKLLRWNLDDKSYLKSGKNSFWEYIVDLNLKKKR